MSIDGAFGESIYDLSNEWSFSSSEPDEDFPPKEGIRIGVERRVATDEDATPQEKADILRLFKTVAEYHLGSEFRSITAALKAAGEANEGFIVRDFDVANGDKYVLYLHAFGGNTDGFIISAQDRKVVAEVLDSGIHYSAATDRAWPA